jgi:hypothetical protein
VTHDCFDLLAMVNVPVPEALPDKAIFDILFSP